LDLRVHDDHGRDSVEPDVRCAGIRKVRVKIGTQIWYGAHLMR
jgi:hypothetical protein